MHSHRDAAEGYREESESASAGLRKRSESKKIVFRCLWQEVLHDRPIQTLFRPIEVEKHPRWATHYIQEIEIVDTTTGKTVETVRAFDTDGRNAVKQARQRGFETIARRCREEGDNLPSAASSS